MVLTLAYSRSEHPFIARSYYSSILDALRQRRSVVLLFDAIGGYDIYVKTVFLCCF